jgi:HEAT repeat protein
MKKLIVLLLVSQCVFSLFGQSDASDFYADRFKRATSIGEQLNVLQAVSKGGSSEGSEGSEVSASFFANALKQLLWQIPDTRTLKEKTALEECLLIIMEQIGNQQYAAAAPDIWRVVERFSNPIVRSEALIALGAIGATDYLPLIIRFLDQNTLYPIQPRDDGEQLAYGAVIALGSLGDPSAYMPVFAVANGWYSRWIKEEVAAKILPQLAEDPAEELIKGISNTFYPLQTRYQALIALEASSASAEAKSRGAQAALREGWTHSPLMSQEVVLLRKRAITMLGTYGVADDQAYTLLRRSYTQSYDFEEQFVVINTLSQLGTDKAVALLVSFTSDINEQHRYGTLRDTDERLIRYLITALGKTDSEAGKDVLREISLVDWTSNIRELARQSITDAAK